MMKRQKWGSMKCTAWWNIRKQSRLSNWKRASLGWWGMFWKVQCIERSQLLAEIDAASKKFLDLIRYFRIKFRQSSLLSFWRLSKLKQRFLHLWQIQLRRFCKKKKAEPNNFCFLLNSQPSLSCKKPQNQKMSTNRRSLLNVNRQKGSLIDCF